MKNISISVERVSTEVEMAERRVGWKWESGSDGTAAVVGMGKGKVKKKKKCRTRKVSSMTYRKETLKARPADT